MVADEKLGWKCETCKHLDTSGMSCNMGSDCPVGNLTLTSRGTMITIKSGTIRLTEHTVREIVKAIDKARAETEFIDPASKTSEMDSDERIMDDASRGTIRVESPYSNIGFVIELDIHNLQDSLGYYLIGPGSRKPIKPFPESLSRNVIPVDTSGLGESPIGRKSRGKRA